MLRNFCISFELENNFYFKKNCLGTFVALYLLKKKETFEFVMVNSLPFLFFGALYLIVDI